MGQNGTDESEPKSAGETPALEWIAAGVGLALTLGMLGFLCWQALVASEAVPPDVDVRIEEILPVSSGWVVEIRAINRSPTTAAAVQIEGELRQDGQVLGTSQATFDYVPGHSEQRGGLFFQDDPGAHELTLRALGYARP